MFERQDKKTRLFLDIWPFSWAIAHSFRDLRWLTGPRKSRYMFERQLKKLVIFVIFGCFHELLLIVLGLFGDLQGLVNPDTFLRRSTKNSSFSSFLAVFMSYCSQFKGSSVTYRDPYIPIHVWDAVQKNSPFSSFLAIFMSYCSQF